MCHECLSIPTVSAATDPSLALLPGVRHVYLVRIWDQVTLQAFLRIKETSTCIQLWSAAINVMDINEMNRKFRGGERGARGKESLTHPDPDAIGGLYNMLACYFGDGLESLPGRNLLSERQLKLAEAAFKRAVAAGGLITLQEHCTYELIRVITTQFRSTSSRLLIP